MLMLCTFLRSAGNLFQSCAPLNMAISNHWTGLLDWITELTFELKLCVSHDLHPIRCAELGHMFDA